MKVTMWSLWYTGYIGHQCQPASQYNSRYRRDVTSTPTTSRGLGLQQHSDFQPTDCCSTAHSDITSVVSVDVTAAARTATTSGLSGMIDLLDEAPLFYIALTSGASFAACLSSVCPSCVVAIVAMTSFVSFAVDSARRYVITPLLNQTTDRWRHVQGCMLMLSDHTSLCLLSRNNNKSAQSNLSTGPRRGSCARRWLA